MPSASELAQLDDEELASRLSEYRRELLNLRFQLATSQLDNTARLSEVRRDVARALTLLREREIALAEGLEAPVHLLKVPPEGSRAREEVDQEPEDLEAEDIEAGELDEAELDEEEDEEEDD